MTFEQGVEHMKNICVQLQKGQNNFFEVGQLRIDYPGYKNNGDYRLSINGTAPKHTDIVLEFYNLANDTNHDIIIEALNDLYQNGLNSTHHFFSQEQKELLYWITLQEEINYPQPKFSGRKLPFQRFYEGVLAKLGHIELEVVIQRTNNHGVGRPKLLNISDINHPIFYI